MYHNKQKKHYLLFNTARIVNYVRLFVLILPLSVLNACSSEKFLLEGQSVLSEVDIKTDSKYIKPSNYRGFIRQEPNAKWFTLVKVPLGIYCMSKADSIKGNKGFSKVLKKIGEAPVIYDEELTKQSLQNLTQGMRSEGFLHAYTDTTITRKRHKTQVTYKMHPGVRFYIQHLKFSFDNDTIYHSFLADSASTFLRQGMDLNLNTLSAERDRVINSLRNRGYYFLNKEYISYDIDTIAGSKAVGVTLRFQMPAGVDSLRAYKQQRFRNITLFENDPQEKTSHGDTISYRSLQFVYTGKPWLNKRTYLTHMGFRANSLYNEQDVQATYGNLNALPAISYTALKINPVPQFPDKLDCDIRLHRKKPHSIGLEVEGTNTSGDLGAAVSLTYSNRNLFKGSEQLSFKLRGAYEAISELEGYSNQNFLEFSAEANLRFPNLLMPLISIDKKRILKASSEAQILYDMQDRPEFHRRVLTGTWAYRWKNATKPNWLHRYDLISLNYIYMPWISDTFRKDYLEGDDPYYSVLRYSYENLFIMRTGYSFTYNSLRDAANLPTGLYQTNGFQVKMNVEFAGNLLYGISKMAKQHKSAKGSYKLFGIEYSQYAKFDFDFAKSVVLSEKNSLAFHIALGIGIPYGNSTILPYEKRYFSGGANSVRGWSVRGLGPGSYKGKDGKINFVNQTGNLKLDLSMEWRTFLFWKLHGAFFIDAGNIWNTRSYPDMEGALFKFNEFYKQIAVSYGIGVRLNFDYFILRLDGGMKAINPAVPSGRLHYPISKPDFDRDFTLHFAVGLPF